LAENRELKTDTFSKQFLSGLRLGWNGHNIYVLTVGHSPLLFPL